MTPDKGQGTVLASPATLAGHKRKYSKTHFPVEGVGSVCLNMEGREGRGKGLS